jgi:hypothetical protein
MVAIHSPEIADAINNIKLEKEIPNIGSHSRPAVPL